MAICANLPGMDQGWAKAVPLSAHTYQRATCAGVGYFRLPSPFAASS